MGYLTHTLVPFLATMLFIVVLRKPARAIGLLDLPGGRKRHERPIPLTGGLGMLLGFTVALMLSRPLPPQLYGSLWLGMVALTIVGGVDDRVQLSPRKRFLAQILAALLLVYVSGLQLTSLGDLFGLGDFHLGMLAVPVTVFFVVALVNAINMADGFDGLAGSVVLVSLLGLAVLAGMAGRGTVVIAVLLALGSSVAGFLVFNLRGPWRRHASVFMGDAGSMMLGFALAWFAIYLAQSPGEPIPPMVIAWMLAYPVFDTVSVMVRRALDGRSLTEPAHDHMHHQLRDAGWSVERVVSVLTLVAVAGAGVGVVGWMFRIPDVVLSCGFLAVWAVHLYIMLRGAKHPS